MLAAYGEEFGINFANNQWWSIFQELLDVACLHMGIQIVLRAPSFNPNNLDTMISLAIFGNNNSSPHPFSPLDSSCRTSSQVPSWSPFQLPWTIPHTSSHHWLWPRREFEQGKTCCLWRVTQSNLCSAAVCRALSRGARDANVPKDTSSWVRTQWNERPTLKR